MDVMTLCYLVSRSFTLISTQCRSLGPRPSSGQITLWSETGVFAILNICESGIKKQALDETCTSSATCPDDEQVAKGTSFGIGADFQILDYIQQRIF